MFTNSYRKKSQTTAEQNTFEFTSHKLLIITIINLKAFFYFYVQSITCVIRNGIKFSTPNKEKEMERSLNFIMLCYNTEFDIICSLQSQSLFWTRLSPCLMYWLVLLHTFTYPTEFSIVPEHVYSLALSQTTNFRLFQTERVCK